jgi:hypothetical protein
MAYVQFTTLLKLLTPWIGKQNTSVQRSILPNFVFTYVLQRLLEVHVWKLGIISGS